MDRTLRKIKRGLWQQEREIIRGLQQKPPVAAWREEMVMVTDCRTGTQVTTRVGAEQDTTPGKAKLLQAPVPGSAESTSIWRGMIAAISEHGAMRRSLTADRHQGFDCFQGTFHISWKGRQKSTQSLTIRNKCRSWGGGGTTSHKILSLFPNDDDEKKKSSCVLCPSVSTTQGKRFKERVLITQTFPSAWYFPYMQYPCSSSCVKKTEQLKENVKI